MITELTIELSRRTIKYQSEWILISKQSSDKFTKRLPKKAEIIIAPRALIGRISKETVKEIIIGGISG